VSTTSTSDYPRTSQFSVADPFDPVVVRVGTPLLVAPFRNGAQFLHALTIGRDLSLRIALVTRADPLDGSDVILETLWPGLPNRTYVRAVVLGRARDGRLVLQFRPDEHAKLDFLARVATGDEANPHKRRHSRYCVRLPLAWRPFGARELIGGVTEDLSIGGVQLLAPASAVVPGERVVIRLQADIVGPDVILTGRVQHARSALGATALGIAFENISSGEHRILRRLLRAFATNGIVLFDPDL
jgi:hypothetical protein